MHPQIAFAALAQSAPAEGAWRAILHSLPTDPASIFTLLLLLGSMGLVLWYGRPGGGKGGNPA